MRFVQIDFGAFSVSTDQELGTSWYDGCTQGVALNFLISFVQISWPAQT